MDNRSKNKPISKGQNGQVKKPYRPTFNNNNPYNKLALNEFHQIQDVRGNDNKKSQAFKLHKKKRDLQRMIKKIQQKGIQVDKAKRQQLSSLQEQLGGRRKKYQKDKRKEFFLEQKYKDIKRIQLRKVYKHLGQTKANLGMTQQEKRKEIDDWEIKLRYIKHFPKTLKYISLFPSAKPFQEKTLEFQRKIMSDIEQQNKKRVTRLNFYKSQNQVDSRGKKINNETQEDGKDNKKSILPLTTQLVNSKHGKKSKKVVDDFFMQQEQQQDQDKDQSEVESELDAEMEVDDEDDIDQEDEQEDQEQDDE